jgi:hypothetical protein
MLRNDTHRPTRGSVPDNEEGTLSLVRGVGATAPHESSSVSPSPALAGAQAAGDERRAQLVSDIHKVAVALVILITGEDDVTAEWAAFDQQIDILLLAAPVSRLSDDDRRAAFMALVRYEPAAEYVGSGDYVGTVEERADGSYVLLDDVLALLAQRPEAQPLADQPTWEQLRQALDAAKHALADARGHLRNEDARRSADWSIGAAEGVLRLCPMPLAAIDHAQDGD